jgi:hypothetical protein
LYIYVRHKVGKVHISGNVNALSEM